MAGQESNRSFDKRIYVKEEKQKHLSQQMAIRGSRYLTFSFRKSLFDIN
jgi:hypothetical protein